MSVVLPLALACTFDSSGLDSTTAVAGPGPSAGSDASTNGASEVEATQPDPSSDAASDGDSEQATDSGTMSASGATTPALCGNGAIDEGEDCDGVELAGASCQSLGHAEGDLLCSEQCQYDEQQCSSPGCGDGELDPGEACDCGAGECTAPQLNNLSCSSLPAPQGGNYGGGTLACASPGPCTYDTTGCTFCGDGAKNGPEVCDGVDLAGQDCMKSGFFTGALACSKTCELDTGACTNCGNMQTDPGEMCDGNSLNGKTCASIDPAEFASGSLSCNGDCGGFSTDNCKAGNCCMGWGGKGCAASKISKCVCDILGTCCSVAWTGTCALTALACGAQC